MFDLSTLKLGLVLLWALWLSLVTVLNISDALKASGRLPETLKFASGNFAYLCEVTKIYGVSKAMNWMMFLGIILWEVVASGLLWWALFSGAALVAVNAAFTVSLALWGAFILADEFFLIYFKPELDTSNTHRSLFLCFLLSLIAIHVL